MDISEWSLDEHSFSNALADIEQLFPFDNIVPNLPAQYEQPLSMDGSLSPDNSAELEQQLSLHGGTLQNALEQAEQPFSSSSAPMSSFNLPPPSMLHSDTANTHSANLHSLIEDRTHTMFAKNKQRDRIHGGRSAWNSNNAGREPFLFGLSEASINEHQIRALPRRKSIYGMTSGSIPILPRRGNSRTTAFTPIQRWQDSPPEDEPASMSAILDAISDPFLSFGKADSRSGTMDSAQGKSSSLPAYCETSSAGNWESANSACSANSTDSAWSAWSSASQVGKPNKHKTRVSKSKKSAQVKNRRMSRSNYHKFPCTFCCDTFKSKYDWVRHEKSLHLNLEEWICSPSGVVVTSSVTGKQHCAFCSEPGPSVAHLNTHNYRICQEKTPESRTFHRKDHLRQHLRLVHDVENMPHIDTWKFVQSPIVCRCGFCGDLLDNWQERADHLAKHFRDGARMIDWRGSHGFEPSIDAQVMNAIPPYLIGAESASLVPFSATNPEVQDHYTQIHSRVAFSNMNLSNLGDDNSTVAPITLMAGGTFQGLNKDISKMTFAELLTFHLGQYAQQQIKNGIVPTDEMFQTEARRIYYGCDDPWNQTIADSHEWLEIFRSEQGLQTPYEADLIFNNE